MKMFGNLRFLLTISLFISTATYASASPVERAKLCLIGLKKIKPLSEYKVDAASFPAANEAFKGCLSQYIQIKTISPKGDEHLAVEFFSAIFKDLKIPFKAYTTPSKIPGQTVRHNLVATLSSDRAESFDYSKDHARKSILLNHHMDVVSAIAEQWLEPNLAFSGKIMKKPGTEKEFIWGRGALDMKSIGILQLVSMVILKKSNIELTSDIHFLAVSDEEQGSSGSIGTLRKMGPGKELYALSRANLMLAESGGAAADILKKGTNLHLIGTEEKGAAWMKIHEKSPEGLIQSMYDLRVIQIDRSINEKNKKFTVLAQKNCKLVKAVTPKSKVNIVASKIVFTLECEKDLLEGETVELLKEAFVGASHTVSFLLARKSKRSLDITLETQSSSHGSVGMSESVLESFANGLYKLKVINIKARTKGRASFFKNIQTSATRSFINTIKRFNTGLRLIQKLHFIPKIKQFMLKKVATEFGVESLFRTTCQFSAFNYTHSKPWAYLDCRLLHTAQTKKKADMFSDQLLRYLANPNLRVEKISTWDVSISPLRNIEFKTLKKAIKEFDHKAVVTPYLFPAGSDNKFFRNPKMINVTDVNPIASYGFFPLSLDAELVPTMHGSNERFPVDAIKTAVKGYFHVLMRMATIPTALEVK